MNAACPLKRTEIPRLNEFHLLPSLANIRDVEPLSKIQTGKSSPGSKADDSHIRQPLNVTEGVLAGVCDVQEAIVILVLFIDAAHESGGGREDLIHEDEDRLLRGELYALSDHVDKLAHGEISGNKILLLVDGSDVRLLDLLTDDWDAISVFLADALGLSLPLLEGVLVLELGPHS